MFDLEHLILFGLPENKLEWFDGRTHCRLPFAARGEAEAAFLRCAETLARWQTPGAPPPVQRDGGRWWVEIGGIKLELLARVLEADLPIHSHALLECFERFWQPSLWPRTEGAPPGGGSGFWEYSEARTNIGIFLMHITEGRRKGWSSGGRVDVSLGDFANVQPHAFYYGPDRAGCLVDESYFVGAPDLIIEILAPATAASTRGPRAELYARAGVPHFWVAVPETDTLETWALEGGRYRLAASHQVGERLVHPLLPEQELDVKEILHSRWGRQPVRSRSGEYEPEYVAALDQPIPLHNLLLGGHPDRRYEVIDDRTPCIVAFGSEAVGGQRFREWADEIARWEDTTVDASGDHIQTPRFDLRRDGPRVALDVTTGVATYRELMRASFDSDAWDEYHKAKGWDRPAPGG